jgi:hypothetical protein
MLIEQSSEEIAHFEQHVMMIHEIPHGPYPSSSEEVHDVLDERFGPM